MEPNKPFIIRSRNGGSLLPPDCDEFNEVIEEKIRFVQSSNIFIICAFIYQCIRFLYYFYHYRTTCYTYAILCLVIIGGNCFWIASSTYGFLGINSRSSSEIGKYMCLTSLVLFIRLVTYFLVWALMQGYATQYNILSKSRLLQTTDAVTETTTPTTTEITDDQKADIVCAQLYQGTLMMIQAIIETIFLIVIIVYVIQVKKYITNYEESQKKKQRKWNLQASIV